MTAGFSSSVVDVVTAFDVATRERVLDLWCAVNDAGGAVGFLPGAPPERVAEALARHEAGMAAAYETAVLLREGETVVGIGWVQRNHNLLMDHSRHLARVMADPTRRRQGLGRALMDGIHRAAAADGVELVILEYRGKTGVGAFYRSCGYAEVGRIPGLIRVAAGDDRDSVIMVRRLGN
jgi:ribosomal protein S18 acetylase RimI-like enzyme